MVKKEITYNNFDGETCTDTLYFNLTQEECLSMSATEDVVAKLEHAINTEDTAEFVKMVKMFVLAGYGERTADGKRFTKVDADGRRLSTYFEATEAFSKLFMELITDEAKATDFFKKMLPDVPVDAPQLTKQS